MVGMVATEGLAEMEMMKTMQAAEAVEGTEAQVEEQEEFMLGGTACLMVISEMVEIPLSLFPPACIPG